MLFHRLSQMFRRGNWLGDVLGALNATASMLPFVLSYGFIAFGALGAAGAQAGLGASVVAIVLGGAVMAIFGRSRLPAASPSVSTCLVIGGAVATLLADPSIDARSPVGFALVFACVGAIVVAAGILTVAFGAVKAGSLVDFVPQPVLAGLMNGVAVLIVVSQLPALLGIPGQTLAREGPWTLSSWHGAPILVALATALLTITIARLWPRAPAPLLAMIAAGIAVWVWQRQGASGSPIAAIAPIGPIATAWPRPDGLLVLLAPSSWSRLARHLPMLGISALVVALVGALESVLNLGAVQQELDERADPNRELVAVGLASIASGVFGGLPLVYMRARALATRMGGGYGARALLIGCALMALVVVFGRPLIEPLSSAVVAGVVVVLAVRLVDRWTHGLVARWWAGDDGADLRASLCIVAIVAVVTVSWGVAAGVGLGIVVSMIVFMRTMHRQLVRARYAAAEFSSRRVYLPGDEAVLDIQRRQISIVELEGALFFGSAQRMADEGRHPPAGTTDVIFDLRRLTAVDASGALALAQVGSRLALRGIVPRLAGVKRGDRHERVLRSHGVQLADGTSEPAMSSAWRIHPDVDRAVEEAERAALDRAGRGGGMGRIELGECQLLQGLTPTQLMTLTPHLPERRLQAGERIFTEGAPGRALYLITEGAVSAIDRQSGQRFATLVPGMCFGETAMLDRAPRTANMVADVASVVYTFEQDVFEALRERAPEVAAQIYLNLARHLSQRLRAATVGWRRAAD